MPLDGVALSRLNLIIMGCILNRVAKMGLYTLGISRDKKILVSRDFKMGRFGAKKLLAYYQK